MPPTPRPDTPPQAARLTSYAILPDAEIIHVEPAHSGDDAVRRWAERQGDDFAGGSYIAIPARSLRRIKVGVRTKREITLGTP